MNTNEFKNGVISATLGSLWWGVLGTYFFQFITFAGTLEVVVHRVIWTSFILFLTTLIFKKWHLLKENIINNLTNIKNLSFKFEQNINGKIETGNCIVEYPKKIFCKYGR